jgi:hypothetical protein
MTARDAAAGLLLSVALVGGNAVYVAHRMDGFVHKPHRVLETDHLRYIEMARGPAGDAELAGEAPFCWRVLVPALARALTRAGLGLNPAFYLLTNLALVAPSHPYEPWAAVADVVAFRLRHLADNQAYVLTVGTWGALVPLALLCPGRLAGLLRRHPEDAALVALVYATLAVSNNTERPLMYALPAVLPAALGSLRRFVEEARLPRGAVFAVVLALQALHYAETVFADVPAASVYQPASLAVVAAMAGAWVAGRAALRRGRLASA